ncbi:MAG: hypothetical protein M1838_006118 [Thelocarpon superellum]|nr:MAG: hypothetical protein M1838_006118 [Thelocarpon superellum]
MDESMEQTIILNETQRPGANETPWHGPGARRKPDPRKTNPVALPPSEALKTVKKFAPPCVWSLYRGLYQAWDTLLKYTAKDSRASRRGASSLFATCLRAVPQYIKEEDQWQRGTRQQPSAYASVLADSDIVDAIYTDLETLGGSSQRGWKPLRQIVRFHGASILADAIRAGFFHANFTKSLVQLSLRHSAHGEAECLVAALAAVASPLAPPSTVDSRFFARQTSIACYSLHLHTISSGRQGFLYRHLAHLFRHRRLAREWLATVDLATTWKEAIQSVSRQDGDMAAAVEFLRTALSLAYAPPLERWSESTGALSPNDVVMLPSSSVEAAFTNTVSSVVATLAAILALAQFHDGPADANVEEKPTAVAHLLEALDTDAMQSLMASGDHAPFIRSRSPELQRAMMLSFAHRLTMHRPIHPEPSPQKADDLDTHAFILYCWMEAWEEQDPAQLPLATDSAPDLGPWFLAEVVGSIVRCCGRASSDHGFGQLGELVRRLIALARAPCPRAEVCIGGHRERWLTEIASLAAVEYASRSGTDEHMKWAESVGAITTCETTKPGPNEEARYRREEGLQDWIVATPAARTDRSRSVSVSTSSVPSSDDDDETPYVRVRRRRAVQTEATTPRLSYLLFGPNSDEPSPEASPTSSEDLGLTTTPNFPQPRRWKREVDGDLLRFEGGVSHPPGWKRPRSLESRICEDPRMTGLSEAETESGDDTDDMDELMRSGTGRRLSEHGRLRGSTSDAHAAREVVFVERGHGSHLSQNDSADSVPGEGILRERSTNRFAKRGLFCALSARTDSAKAWLRGPGAEVKSSATEWSSADELGLI